ncbi:GAF and ANTAR domain-containing protein [Aeromicrobium sp. CTD01-1L150]|uniref:GAF and ANTAR domain-containing protein n=1 Tax=Aeromicrobium sp. CTD01-1L150 TaxID=3341830 RepID=UPI0035C05A2E
MDTAPEVGADAKGRNPLDLEFSRIALELHDASGSEQTIERITEYARSAIGSEDAGVLLVHTRSRIETAAATSATVAKAHALQADLDEGPCLDALQVHDTVVRIDDAAQDERWPRWCAALVDLGFRSVLSVPLATSDRLYGSVNLFAVRADAFTVDDEAVASILARHASVALAASHDIEGLRKAIDARKLIGMAMGMLMERFSIDGDRAFQVLRRYSQDHNVKLRDLAERVVSGGDLPSD